MSLKAMVWAFGVKCPSPTAKLVLVKICENANEETMTAWPSREHIARQVQVSTRTVTTTIQQLADAGLLSVEPRYVDGRQTSNTYRVHYGAGEPIDSGVKDLHAGVKQFPGGVENLSRGGGSQLPAEPSIEPVIEPNGSLSAEPTNEPDDPVIMAAIASVHEMDAAVDAYNETARRASLPTVRKLTKQRQGKLRARLKDCGGLIGWREALAKLEASSHCTGGNDRGWRACLDFLLQESSFVKLIEGAYDDKRPKYQNGSGQAHQRALMPGEW